MVICLANLYGLLPDFKRLHSEDFLGWGISKWSPLCPCQRNKKNRNLRRLEAFLLKKKGQSFHQSKPQAASGSHGTSEIPSVPNNSEACNGVAMLSSAGAASHDSESYSKSDSRQIAVVSRSTPSLATPIQTDSPVAYHTRSKDLQIVLVVTVTIYYPIPS